MRVKRTEKTWARKLNKNLIQFMIARRGGSYLRNTGLASLAPESLTDSWAIT